MTVVAVCGKELCQGDDVVFLYLKAEVSGEGRIIDSKDFWCEEP